MGAAIYAFVFSAIMSANAVSTNKFWLSVIDWVAVGWLFLAGVVSILQFYRSREYLEVDLYDED